MASDEFVRAAEAIFTGCDDEDIQAAKHHLNQHLLEKDQAQRISHLYNHTFGAAPLHIIFNHKWLPAKHPRRFQHIDAIPGVVACNSLWECAGHWCPPGMAFTVSRQSKVLPRDCTLFEHLNSAHLSTMIIDVDGTLCGGGKRKLSLDDSEGDVEEALGVGVRGLMKN